MDRYLPDSNIFITSEHYIPRDIFPSFWDSFGKLFESGDLVLHQTVSDELSRHKDFILFYSRHCLPVLFQSLPTSA